MKVLIFVLVVSLPLYICMAQPSIPKNSELPTYTQTELEGLMMNAQGPIPPEPPPPQVPISGIEILIGLGVILGFKRFRSNVLRNRKDN
ncbi:MAG TPA: hypothetical protein PKC24_02480 [Cyclobacteriaceae bacterium]|nr:hypothetical protein [Cyclobacteriaceae bacterium]